MRGSPLTSCEEGIQSLRINAHAPFTPLTLAPISRKHSAKPLPALSLAKRASFWLFHAIRKILQRPLRDWPCRATKGKFGA